MKIAICSSIEFTNEIKEVMEKLEDRGHEVEIPLMSKKIMDGEVSFEEFKREKRKSGDGRFRKMAGEDLIKRYFKIIRNSDAILVLNLDKNGIENYIGGNTFLEMGFAYVLEKKIFLFNKPPEMGYKDEIAAMSPVIIDGNLDRIL